jgi:hypothetical protein
LAYDEVDAINAIKQIVRGVVESEKPTALTFAEVTSVSPLLITVDQRLTLTGEELILGESLPSLFVGDKVALLRQRGGQTFYVLDKLKESDA